MAASERKRPLGPTFSVAPPRPETDTEAMDTQEPLVGPDQKRRDGRLLKQLRSIFIRTDVISSAAGSAYFEQGGTKVMCAVHGPHEGRGGQFAGAATLDCELEYAPFAQGTVGSLIQDANAKDLSAQLDSALALSIQLENYPKSVIDVHVTVLENAGGVFAAALTCASVALAHAGIHLYDLVSASTVVVVEGHLISDPSIAERRARSGEVVVGLMPALNEVSFVMATGQLAADTPQRAIEQAMDACAQVHAVMQEALRKSIETEAAA
eukprot:comp16629_c0_seq1/m.14813 comp16629_c0_seq1/g.14813  ORF comp16629_c0_seq1/g.14813 comp16629_c0_seq1/m.14813 type:complete len:267 (-) comp16629_c0_seq1:641-1441(-)